MIALVNSLEGQLWQIILDAFGHDDGQDSGPYLGPGDARLKEKQVIRCCKWCPEFKTRKREPKYRATCCIRCPIYEDCRRDPRREE